MEAEALHARFLTVHGQASAAVALARKSMGRALPQQAGDYATRESWRAWIWAAIEIGDATAVRQALAAYADKRHAREDIDIAQAWLAAAQLLNDEALRLHAMSLLEQHSPARRAFLCHSPSKEAGISFDWQNLERRLQYESAQAAGLCPR